MQIFEQIGKKNICLIGLMGSGKSVIAKDLSKILEVKHFDSDNEIEKNQGTSINSIFENCGESQFRQIEEEICINLLNKKNIVISLGGGSIINKNIRKIIKISSFSIYLKVSLDVLTKRLNSSNKRPLLKNVDKKDKLEQLYNERKEFYNKADLVIENNFDKNDILKKIKSKLNI